MKMGREITNPVRRYYSYNVDRDTSHCHVDSCNKIVKGNHAANLQRHVARWHPKAYRQLVRDKKRIAESSPIIDNLVFVAPQLQVPVKQPAATPLKRPLQMKPLAPKPRPVSPPQLPPPPPEVCLRWNSYHSNMQATFPALLVGEQFVDVTLACEGRSIKCHKMILSACSSYFDELLSQNPCQHPIVLMKDLKFWEVQALVDFMYRGEVNVGQDKLPFLLAAAEALQIKGLASPASSTPGPDEDSASVGADPEYLDDVDVPSPSSARRARRRRTIATLPPQQQAPLPTPAFRSSRPQKTSYNNNNSVAQPSTSGFSSYAREPPTRKRKMESSEFDVGDHYMREIKLEPVDIDASSDSLDQAAELFQITCNPTPCDLPFQSGTVERPPGKRQHDPGCNPLEVPARRPTEEPERKPSGDAAVEPEGTWTADVSQKPAEEPMEEPTEEPERTWTEDATEEPEATWTGDVSDKPAEEPMEDATEGPGGKQPVVEPAEEGASCDRTEPDSPNQRTDGAPTQEDTTHQRTDEPGDNELVIKQETHIPAEDKLQEPSQDVSAEPGVD